eukprot:m.10199 g.10199  ORF g.10199 m.10199 type:complete len:200 (+) comp9611_c0_seq2:220-819(+)
MALTESEVLALSLGAVLGGFALIAIAIVAWFLRKHHRNRASLTERIRGNGNRHRDARNRTLLLNPVFDDEFLDVDVIPDVVALLRSCKLLSQRLMSTMLQEASVVRDHHVQRIVEVSKLIGPRAAALAESMYSPDEAVIIRHATALVTSIDQLVSTAKACCEQVNIPWLDDLAVVVLADFRRLALSVDHMQAQRSALSA